MALRAVTEHPKFSRLKVILGVGKAVALGYLECLWHFAGRFTPDGALSKYEPEEIEAWLEWDGEPGALIAALIKSRWIDQDPTHGLIVHDWHKHADDATKLALKRAGLEFIVPTVSRQCPDTFPTPSGLPGAGAGAGAGAEPGAVVGERAPAGAGDLRATIIAAAGSLGKFSAFGFEPAELDCLVADWIRRVGDTDQAALDVATWKAWHQAHPTPVHGETPILSLRKWLARSRKASAGPSNGVHKETPTQKRDRLHAELEAKGIQ